MGIVHLNVEPSAELVTSVESVFDAVVELRIKNEDEDKEDGDEKEEAENGEGKAVKGEGGRLEQRWRLRESNLVTGWIPLSETTPP